MHRLSRPEEIDESLPECVRALLRLRFHQLSDNGVLDAERQGYFVVAEAGDTVEALEAATGCPIFGNWVDECRYGDPDFSPGFEWLVETGGCYEVVFITNDDGYAITLLVFDTPGIDPDLIAFCQEHASAP